MEVWPGYDTSILKFEVGPGLLVDVIHKMVSVQTVHDVMADLWQRSTATFKDRCLRELVGQIVITKYVLSMTGYIPKWPTNFGHVQKHRGSIGSQSTSPSNSPLLPSMHCAGNFVPEFPSINSSAM